MARNLVTRHCVVTDVMVKRINTETDEVSIAGIQLGKLPKNEEKVMKLVKAKLETDTMKVVSIVSVEEKKEHRAMTEETYIENSYIIEEKEN